MIFCARATRGLRRPSLDARSGRSISPIPERGRRELRLLGQGASGGKEDVLADSGRLGEVVAWVGPVRGAFWSILPIFSYCPRRAAIEFLPCRSKLLQHCLSDAQWVIGQVLGISVILQQIFPIIRFV